MPIAGGARVTAYDTVRMVELHGREAALARWTLEDIRGWIAADESETLELKETTGQRSDGTKTLCAFLNTRGGRVLFGVTPAGYPRGQDVTDKTLRDIAEEVRHIEPPAFPDIDRIDVGGGKEVIVVAVGRGQRRPYTDRGKAYRRLSSTTVEMSREEYNAMLLEVLHSTRRWESEVADGWTVDNLDTTEVQRTIDEGIRRGRLDDPGSRDPTEMLRGLGVTREGALLRAAVVLFGRDDRLLPDFPQCLLRVARFRGTDRTDFVDNRQFHGNAFELLKHAERFLRDSLPVASRIVPGVFERQDDPLYPPLALREALANALCHRDYEIGGGSVAIGIYDDRLEITSSGSLHFGLTAAALYRRHESLPWNPIIASVFYRRGFIESWGRGTLKMAELAEQAGLPRPEIDEIAGAVLVRFLPARYLPPHRIGHDLSERQRAILEALGAGVPMALQRIVADLGSDVSSRGVREDLRLLRTLGLVELSSHGRGARWSLMSGFEARDVPSP
jgi:ATP-dependent DNA helicase RecG